MLAVFDTNVIVSGLLFKGSTKDLFTFVDSGKITLCFTPNIFAEIQRVLTYTHLQPALKKNLISQEEMMDFLRDHSELFEDVSVFNLVKDDSTDNKFIDCAFVLEHVGLYPVIIICLILAPSATFVLLLQRSF